MLRLGVSSVAKTTSTKHSSIGTRFSSRFFEARYFSSKPLGEKQKKKDSIADSDEKDGGTDALRLFFEKRREALQKGKQQEQGTKENQRNPKNRNRPQQTRGKPNTESSLRHSATTVPKPTGESEALQSFFEKRQAALQKGPKGRDIASTKNTRRNTDPNDKRNRWVPKGKQQQNAGNWTKGNTGNRNQNSPRENQRFQGRRQPEFQGNDSSRLADLMKQLRRDAPIKTPAAGATDDQSFWRPGAKQERGEEARWNRGSFLNKNTKRKGNMPMPRQNNRGGGGGQRFQNQRKDSDFLEGRRNRVENDKMEQNAFTSEETQVVTIPGSPITLSEVSALLRVRMHDIKRKLRSMGERAPEDSESLMTVDSIELLALEFGIETERSVFKQAVESEDILISQRRVGEEAVALPPRPPVVCIMVSAPAAVFALEVFLELTLFKIYSKRGTSTMARPR